MKKNENKINQINDALSGSDLNKSNNRRKKLNIKRLDELAEAYAQFTVMANNAANGKTFQDLKYTSSYSHNKNIDNDYEEEVYSSFNSFKPKKMIDGNTSIDPVVTSLVKILFSAQGNYVQEIILDEAVRITDALTRSFILTTLSKLPIPGRRNKQNNSNNNNNNESSINFPNPFFKAFNMMNPLKAFQVLNPLNALNFVDNIFKPSEEDIESLIVLRRLLQILAGTSSYVSSDEEIMNKIDSNKQSSLSSPSSLTFNASPSSILLSSNQYQPELLDRNDLKLIQKVITQIAGNLIQNFTGGSSNNNNDYDGNNNKGTDILNRLDRLSIIRSQLVNEIIPLVRESTPGLRKISRTFLRKLVERSASRLTTAVITGNTEPLPPVL